MDINEEKLRRKIWEILVNSPEITDIIKKQNKQELQKKVYNDVVDLKGYLEKEKDDKALEVLKGMIGNLQKFRDMLEKNIVD